MQQRSREWQAEQLRRTGFVGNAELGHQVYAALVARGYRRRDAELGAQLAAVNGPCNWMGCPRLALLLGWSLRTVQRARLVLETAGLIQSYCLGPGDRLPGMRAPVRRPVVVRDVTPLQQLPGMQSDRVKRHVASKGLTPRRRPPSSARPSAADRPAPAAPPQELVPRAEIIAFAAGLAEHAERVPVRPAHGGPAAHEAEQRSPAPSVHAAPPAELVAVPHEPTLSMPAPGLAEPERVTPERCRTGDDSPHERGPPS